MKSNVEDINLARSLLEEDKWNLVIVKEGQVLVSSRERGVAPLYKAVRNMVDILHNAALADRVVGLAVAMLCLYARITSVYAGIASQGALDLLEAEGVTVSSKSVVPYISNYDGTGLCPFEKMARDSTNPAQLFSSLESIFGGYSDGGDAFS